MALRANRDNMLEMLDTNSPDEIVEALYQAVVDPRSGEHAEIAAILAQTVMALARFRDLQRQGRV